MEMIAASKMKRAQERGIAGRPYAEKIRQVIADLAALPQAGGVSQPLLQSRPVNKIAIVHITPDRGLCGGLVTNLISHGYENPIEVEILGYDFKVASRSWLVQFYPPGTLQG